jgi:hypothetical protein
MADNENLNSENLDKNNKEQNNSTISKSTQNETKEEKSKEENSDAIKKKKMKSDSKTESPLKKDDDSIKSAPNQKTKSRIIKNIKGHSFMDTNATTANATGAVAETEEKSNSNHLSKNSDGSFSKEDNEEENDNNDMDNEDEKKPAPISNLNSNLKSSNINNTNNTTNTNTTNTNNNTFLGRKHYPEKSTHLLADAIMKQEFQAPQKKVSVQRNQSKSNKILDLIESDSEINNDDNEEKDNDEDYNINESGNDKINKKKKRPVRNINRSDDLDSKDKESIYYKEEIGIMITLMEMGAMLVAGTVFSAWMAKHDNLEVR